MKRVGLMLVTPLAAIALGGITSSSASATSFCFRGEAAEGNYANDSCSGATTVLSSYILEETERYIGNGLWCGKTNAGTAILRYTNPTCTTESTPVNTGQYGKIEGPVLGLTQGFLLVNFTSKAVGSTVLRESAGTAITCTGATGIGSLNNNAEGVATVKFTGCSATGGTSCSSTGASAKEIVSPESSKIVSYENSAKETKAALLAAPRNAAGENLQSNIKCGTLAVEVRGSVTGRLANEAEATTKSTVKWAVNASQEQEIPDSAKPLEVKLGSSGSFEKATQAGEATFQYEDEVVVLG